MTKKLTTQDNIAHCYTTQFGDNPGTIIQFNSTRGKISQIDSGITQRLSNAKLPYLKCPEKKYI